jgi:hypothetical protein
MPVPDVVVAHAVNDQDGRRQEEWTKIADRRRKNSKVVLQGVDVGRFMEVINAGFALLNCTESGRERSVECTLTLAKWKSSRLMYFNLPVR